MTGCSKPSATGSRAGCPPPTGGSVETSPAAVVSCAVVGSSAEDAGCSAALPADVGGSVGAVSAVGTATDVSAAEVGAAALSSPSSPAAAARREQRDDQRPGERRPGAHDGVSPASRSACGNGATRPTTNAPNSP